MMRKRMAARTGWLLWLLCVALLWVACQPYLDHEEQAFSDDFEVVDLGPKRQLELTAVRPDRDSVLFVFNQPLRLPTNQRAEPPFSVSFHPPVVVRSTEFEGVAGVRVRFASPLPPSSSFTAQIPAGWRAPSGVSLWYPLERSWTTARPALSKVTTQNGSEIALSAGLTESVFRPGSDFTLDFNQPVALNSVRSALRWERVDESGGKPVSVPFVLTELPANEGEMAHQRFLLTTQSGGDEISPFRLVLAAGVRGLSGPLRGASGQRLLFQPRRDLRYQGPASLTDLGRPLILKFSAPVRAEEVARCLLAVPQSGRPRVSQESGLPNTSVSLSFSGPLPNRVVLLAGLSSEDGPNLPTDLEIPILSPHKEPSKPVPLTPIALPLGQRSLLGSQGPTATWTLNLRQAILASQTPEPLWTSTSPLSWERVRPTFQADAKLTKKFSSILGKGGGQPAFLAVRRSPTKTTRERALLAQTDLGLQLFPGTGGVLAKLTSLSTGLPLPDCKLDLYDRFGTLLQRSDQDPVSTDPQGEGKLPWSSEMESMEVGFVVASRANDTTFAAFEPELCRPGPELPLGFLHCDRPFYGPGESVVFRGFTWQPPLPRVSHKAAVTVVSEQGRTVLTTTVDVDSLGFFLARFKAPELVGLHRLTVTLASGAKPLVSEFRVCPIANFGESYSLAVELGVQSATIDLQREGPQYRPVGVRAYLRKIDSEVTQAGGWTRLSDRVPYWYPLGLKSGSGHDGTVDLKRVGGWSRRATLVVEAFDLEDPRLVVCREERSLDPTRPQLQLQVENDGTDPHQQSVRFQFSPDAADLPTSSIDVTTRLMFRAQDRKDAWTELDSRAFRIDGGKDTWPLWFPRPGDYQLRVELKTDGEPSREVVWERSVASAVSTLQLDPGALAKTGEALTIKAMDWTDRSKQLFGVELFGSLVDGLSVMSPTAEGVFGPLLIPPARARSLRVILSGGVYPSWGQQSPDRQRWVQELSMDPSSSRGAVSLDVGRLDRVNEPIRGDHELSVEVRGEAEASAWRGTLGWRRMISGWDHQPPDLPSSYFGQEVWSPPSPAGYPLLTAEQLNSTATWGGMVVEPEAELEVPAPKRAGSYLWTFIGRDANGRFATAETVSEVGDSSGWSVVAPWGVRAGDSFAAGLRFLSGSGESGPIGLAATAVGRDALLPSAYTRTDGVVKRGEEQLLDFEYRVPLAPSSEYGDVLPLQWELGYQGKRASQRAEVPVWPAAPVATGAGRTLLNAKGTARMRVNGPLRWRLVLETPKPGSIDTLVSVAGPQGSLGKVLLRAGKESVSLEGTAPGTVHVKHLRGGPISLQMFRLEPDLGETSPWGSRVYLFRGIFDEQGVPATTLVHGQTGRIVLDLVNPAQLRQATLRLPLPGGTMPLSVDPVDETATRVPWRIEPGAMVLDLENLEPGEYRWQVNVAALTTGDFLWPTARVTTPDGQLQALSGSSRVRILDQ